MTWQMASFALLAIALAGGFAWYERAHPSAKVLALVATLAALAALGRIAFAPVPSVKPTTDIVLLAGYALGAAPGLMVGAGAALVSNFFFGQGPWTPWMMAGWGGVGLLGAGLAALAGRDLGRWPLAVVCGVAGMAYGVWMDFHLWTTYTGHTAGEAGVLLGRGLPFNIAHGAANVAFCLAFGPMLVRSLRRFRDRFEITWRPAPAQGAPLAVVAVLAVVATAAAAAPAHAAQDQEVERAVDRAVDYLRASQTRDGGFADERGGDGSNPLTSGWAVIGLAAAGHEADDGARRYLRGQAADARDIGDIERTVLAMRAAGLPNRSLARILLRRRERNGSWEDLVNRTAFGILAVRAAGGRAPARSVAWLRRQQNRDGGWSVGGRGGPSGVDDTATAVMALAAVRGDDRRVVRSVRRGLRWLARRQGSDGGFPLTPGEPSNAQSTAFVVQAFVAAGRRPDRLRRDGSRDPIEYLLSLQSGDGSIRYSRTSDQTPTWVTAQAVAALAGDGLPVRPPRRARARSATATIDLRAFAALIMAVFV